MMRPLRIAAVSFAVLIAALNLCAQDEAANAPDPPSRVARLSYLSGDVSFQPGGVDDWIAANLNRPLTTSDRLWTAKNARAELQTDNASMRIDGETSYTLAYLDDARTQIQIADGALNITLRQLNSNETFEIDTPNLTLNLLRAGTYRVQVDNANNVSWVTIRSGSAEATGGPQAITLQPGQQATFSGADGATYEVNAAPGLDGFDQWCYARDRKQESARSAEYVSRNVIGYEDLDDYGTWRTYEDYGYVWVPRVVTVGWAPYHYGHWAWIYPWGWTWVDDAPWGFAPFHYGRWIRAGFGWAWVPGPVYVRPVYAPALVAWCGGTGWGVGVGWFPLGPREPFIPWYWGSRHYFSRVNVTNTTIINVNNYYDRYYHPRWRDHDGRDWRDRDNRGRDHDGRDGRDHAGPGGPRDVRTIADIDYKNRRTVGGVTFVDRDAFVRGRPVAKSAIKLSPDRLRNGAVLTDIDAKPDRASVLGGHDVARVRPPQKAFNRPFVSRTVAPKPMPFEKQTQTFTRPVWREPQVQNRTIADRPGAAPVRVTAPERRGNVAGPDRERRPNQPESGRLPVSGPRVGTPDQPQSHIKVSREDRIDSNASPESRRAGPPAQSMDQQPARPHWTVPKPPNQLGNRPPRDYNNNVARPVEVNPPQQNRDVNVERPARRDMPQDRTQPPAPPSYRPPQQERPVAPRAEQPQPRVFTPPAGVRREPAPQPPVQQRVERAPAPPQQRMERAPAPPPQRMERAPAPPPQRTERPPEVHQSAPHVDRSAPRNNSGDHNDKGKSFGNPGRRW